MLKKLISMATATLVLAGGLSVVASPMASATDPVVTDSALTVPVPVTTLAALDAVAGISESQQYQVTTLSWYDSTSATNATGSFVAGHVYVATLHLLTSSGPSGYYTFNGLAANFFTVSGSTSTEATFAVDGRSADVDVVFPVVPVALINISHRTISGLTAPVVGATPVTSITDDTQFTGTVNWNPSHSTFQVGTAYTATVIISPTSGYKVNDPYWTPSVSMPGQLSGQVSYVSGANGSYTFNVTYPSLQAQQQNNNNQQQQQQGSNDATLTSITVKGAAATLGTPNANIASSVPGAVTITPDVAASTASTLAIMRTPGGMATVMKRKYSSGSNPTAMEANMASNFSTGSIADGDVLIFIVYAGDVTTVLYYKVIVTVSTQQQQQQQQNNNSSSSSDAASLAAAAKAAAAVAAAKTTLVETLKAGKPFTVTDLNAAGITVASVKAGERVAAKVLALPEVLRTDLAKVEAIVKTENFVDKVSTPATQISVTTRDLVIHELLTSDYKYKTSVVKAILAKDAADLDSIEKIQAVVKAQLAAIDARKARIAAVQARVLTYSQK